jgi:hypothetical protein
MSPQTHAFQPGNRQCVPAQKRSSLWAFCVSGLDIGRPLEVAAVTVLRGNGGTFPSRPEMSDPQGVQEPGEGAHTARNPASTGNRIEAVCVDVPSLSRRESRQCTSVLLYRRRLGECWRATNPAEPSGNGGELGKLQRSAKGELRPEGTR